MHEYTCICVYMPTCVELCVYVCIHVYIHVCVHMCIYTCVCLSLCVCLSACSKASPKSVTCVSPEEQGGRRGGNRLEAAVFTVHALMPIGMFVALYFYFVHLMC